MIEWLADARHAKTLGLLILFTTFCLIVLWVYGSKKRGERLEQHKNIPFLDDTEVAKDDNDGK